jgi:hypothetical protein
VGSTAFLALSHPAALPQVVSPLTEAVLGETLLTVTEEKVSITQLQAQVVASLALSLRPSPGSSHTILATTAAQQTLSFLKQVNGYPTHQLGSLGCDQMTGASALPYAMSSQVKASGNRRSVRPRRALCLPHPVVCPAQGIQAGSQYSCQVFPPGHLPLCPTPGSTQAISEAPATQPEL